VRVPIADGKPGQTEDFATGRLMDEKGKEIVWGRPVDVLVGPDGSLFVSDDFAGLIYRIRYKGR
jgi:glucose/arabinose dehydrogenase